MHRACCQARRICSSDILRPSRNAASTTARHRWSFQNKTIAAAAAISTPRPEEDTPPWRQVVGILAGSLLLCNLHRSTFAVLLPDLAQQLNLTASQTGAIHAAMLSAYLLGQIPAGRLADKYSGTRVLLWGLALWSAATASTAVAGFVPSNSLWPLAVIVISRLLMGLASACAMPCVTATAVKWVPAAQRASAIGFVYANFNVGGVVGLTLLPLLADLFGGPAAFVIAGAAGMAMAITGSIVMHKLQPGGLLAPAWTRAAAVNQQTKQGNSIQQQQLLQRQLQQQDALVHNIAAQQHGDVKPHFQQKQAKQWQQLSWKLDAASWRRVGLLCFAHAIMGYGFFLMQNWMPLYVSSLGDQSLAVTGRLSSMPWLAAAVAGMVAGSAADGLIQNGLPTLFVRRLMQGLSFLGCAASVLPLATMTNPGLLPAVLCLTANLACYSLSYGGFHAYLQDVAGKYAGVLQGITNSASILMGVLGNLLTGVVVELTGSYSAVFWLLVVMYSGAAAMWCVFTSSYVLKPTS